jgi:hypothetical protein
MECGGDDGSTEQGRLFWSLYLNAQLPARLVPVMDYALVQHFSNCGLRTTSGPRVLPLWSS